MQNDFLHRDGSRGCENPEAKIDISFVTGTIPHVKRLADTFRAAGRPPQMTGSAETGFHLAAETTYSIVSVMRLPIKIGGPADTAWIKGFLRNRWGDITIVVHGEVIEAATLPALIALAENRRGLATYRQLGRDAELVTLDADPAGIGTGTALVEALAARLRADGCERLWLTTTNDKLSALRFYLRLGFRLIEVRLGAVDDARKLKPSIPTVGEYGIPMRDELDLCRVLDARITGREVFVPPWGPARKPASSV
jgi:GNAT superfamily N-acetyltransferase